jgi:signal transduction histidine kinase
MKAGVSMRRISEHKVASFLAAAALACGILAAMVEPGIISPFIILGIIAGVMRIVAPPLSRRVSRVRLSIRWKILGAISLMAALMVGVSIVNIEAMDYMHLELHAIQDLGQNPSAVLAAVDELENTQHGPFFSLAPLLSMLAAILAMTLGIAVAMSVITPVRQMGIAMRRIAAGDFSQPIALENRDELGELASSINQTAQELVRLQEATLTEERARALQDRVTQVTLAQEEERRRISRELHDDLGPSLAAIVNRLRTCQQLVRSDPSQAEKDLDEVTKGLKGHIQDIRHLIYDLRPLAVDQLGLAGAIEQQLERFSKDTGVRASSSFSPQAAVDPLAEVTVFRVLQECLSNVQKHSAATRVDVGLQPVDSGVELTVRDDGRGFAPDAGSANTTPQGVGLVSMRERAELVGGRLTVESRPGAGCSVVLYVPSRIRAVAGSREEAALGTNTNPDR